MNYLKFPNFNPIIFSYGYLSLHWYGFMYILSFLIILKLSIIRINKLKNINKKELEIFLYNCFLYLLIGGRVGYILFYNLNYFLKNPITIFEIWNGGMSFHGGLIGAIIYIIIYSYKNKHSFLMISDFISQLVPIGLFFGRLGNFINGELWGRINTKISWAMIFPNSRENDLLYLNKHTQYINLFKKYGSLPRHPSQIYEMFFEGFILYILLNIPIKNKNYGIKTSLFLIIYSLFRIILEIFREPDMQIGLIKNYITMGQLLCIPMLICGIIIFYFNLK